MCREAEDSINKENTMLVGMDRDIERLSHELQCLTDLWVLSSEEEDALSAFIEDLRDMLARTRCSETPAAGCRNELSRMVKSLAVDLDLAYQRLCNAV